LNGPAKNRQENRRRFRLPAKSNQVGGDHYKSMAIQPIDYILANNIGFVEGCVIKYVSRWKSKGGVEDLKKARHFLDLLIERVP
jgi:hypothetical protein